MRNYKNLLLNKSSTVKEALQIIEKGAKRICIVVDKNEKLIGTITDGDIRRALLKKVSLNDSIDDIINTNPVVCHVNDSHETILNIAIKKKLYQIPIVNNQKKLVEVKDLDELINPRAKSNAVIIMVGGYGTRLRPLTEDTPKPMLNVGGKPILETIIDNFKKYGFTNILLSVNYKSSIIKNYFKDGAQFGVNITYINENKKLGTAGALSLMTDLLTDNFFVMNGDLLTNINFEHMLKHHLDSNAQATMGVREYEIQIPYGVVNTTDKEIKSIDEKPIHSFFVNGGIYILNKEVVSLIPHNNYFDMPELFNQIISTNLKTTSYPITEYWLDIGEIETYKKANYEYNEVFNVQQ